MCYGDAQQHCNKQEERKTLGIETYTFVGVAGFGVK
jgi:hypothetical protein